VLPALPTADNNSDNNAWHQPTPYGYQKRSMHESIKRNLPSTQTIETANIAQIATNRDIFHTK
jgi:hypothetical protein